MSDLIDRQAAIDALERTKEKDPKSDIASFYNTITDNKIAVIEALPSVQPEKRTQERTETNACDLISRQAAIDAIEDDNRNGHYSCFASNSDAQKFKQIVNELPSAQPEQWIPVSERLPDIGEHYVSEPCIVYCSNGAYGFAELEENIFGQVGWNCERDDEYHEPLGEVLAWMPLPEPYKGDKA